MSKSRAGAMSVRMATDWAIFATVAACAVALGFTLWALIKVNPELGELRTENSQQSDTIQMQQMIITELMMQVDQLNMTGGVSCPPPAGTIVHTGTVRTFHVGDELVDPGSKRHATRLVDTTYTLTSMGMGTPTYHLYIGPTSLPPGQFDSTTAKIYQFSNFEPPLGLLIDAPTGSDNARVELIPLSSMQADMIDIAGACTDCTVVSYDIYNCMNSDTAFAGVDQAMGLLLRYSSPSMAFGETGLSWSCPIRLDFPMGMSTAPGTTMGSCSV